MKIDYQGLRIEGIYRQNDAGQLMLRVKLASGLLSVTQASTLARLGQAYGRGTFHLTTRGSIEFHDLDFAQLPAVQRGLASVGLFSRGACGGAVRGISTGTGFGRGFHYTQVLGRKLLMHFSGNPYFEDLPKKFKIAVESDYAGSRHLIQDLAFVYVDQEAGQALYDVWVAGGLGRAPQAAILYRERVAEAELLSLAEAIIRVYNANVLPPKRLKALLSSRGEGEFRRLLAKELAMSQILASRDSFDKTLLPISAAAATLQLVVPVFAGELAAVALGKLVRAAAAIGIDYLLVTADQNLALLPDDLQQRQQLIAALSTDDFAPLEPLFSQMRVCPGSPDCRMGLSATRDLAASLLQRFGGRLLGRSLAISGCGNSCAQPQLAEFGIIASQSVKGVDMGRTPRFDLYRRNGSALGVCCVEGMLAAELFAALDLVL